MELLIKPWRDAIAYIPYDPTYAIRIFSSSAKEKDKPPLHSSSLWVQIAEYVFDDNTETRQVGPKTIDDEIATSIIMDFARHKDEIEALLVHCTFGRNRSPAVAMALNEIFGLGRSTEGLRDEYVVANLCVYQKLLEVAQTLVLT